MRFRSPTLPLKPDPAPSFVLPSCPPRLSASIAEGSTNAPTVFPVVASTEGNASINHVAVYRRGRNMKTARPAHPSNVVNACFTLISQTLPPTVVTETHAI